MVIICCYPVVIGGSIVTAAACKVMILSIHHAYG